MGDNPREIQHLSDHLEKGFTVWIAARNKEVLEGLKQRIQEKDLDTGSVVFRLVRDFNSSELDPK
jgi:short-subunit dehydrogenase